MASESVSKWVRKKVPDCLNPYAIIYTKYDEEKKKVFLQLGYELIEERTIDIQKSKILPIEANDREDSKRVYLYKKTFPDGYIEFLDFFVDDSLVIRNIDIYYIDKNGIAGRGDTCNWLDAERRERRRK